MCSTAKVAARDNLQACNTLLGAQPRYAKILEQVSQAFKKSGKVGLSNSSNSWRVKFCIKKHQPDRHQVSLPPLRDANTSNREGQILSLLNMRAKKMLLATCSNHATPPKTTCSKTIPMNKYFCLQAWPGKILQLSLQAPNGLDVFSLVQLIQSPALHCGFVLALQNLCTALLSQLQSLLLLVLIISPNCSDAD